VFYQIKKALFLGFCSVFDINLLLKIYGANS